MEEFRLYVSGILLGKFWQEDGRLLHSPLGLEKPEYAPAAPLNEASDSAYRVHARFSPLAVLSRLEKTAAALADSPAEIEIAGARYTQGSPGHYQQRGAHWPVDIWLEEGKIIAFLCPSRDSMAILVRAGYESATPLARWGGLLSAPLQGVKGPFACRVPMRDGTKLAGLCWLPDAPGPFPTILVRTPYNKEKGAESYWRFVRRGYAVLVQDVRGKGESEGEWLPHYYEVEDGSDTLDWIAAQPWSNGRVGSYGGSYLGYVQWCTAASGNPHLKAMVSMVTAGSSFVDIVRRGGAWCSGSMAWNFSVSGKDYDPSLMERDDWAEVLDVRPLDQLDTKALGHPIPFWHKMLDHPDEDEFWKMGDWKSRYAGPPVPVLIQSGWFDDNGMGTTEALDLTAGWPCRRVILGPWHHAGNSTYDLHALSFGENAIRWDLDLLYLNWLDHYLAQTAPLLDGPAVEYYSTGAGRWKQAASWPPAGCRPRQLYLDGDRLTGQLPEKAGRREYRYDPSQPASQLIDMEENELAVPGDYSRQELRGDYLVFSTPALTAPLTITGDCTVTLWVESTAPDTDFVVRICDAGPEGSSIRLADGVLRARYREGFDHPVWLQPGQPARLTIRTSKLSHTFLPGHRLRLTVTSSAKNLIFPHPNTRAAEQGEGWQTACNTVHTGGAFASCLLLPVEE